MDLPEPELKELASILDSGELTPLRDRFDHPRHVQQELQRFTNRIYLFPFGVHPDRAAPVQVFRNGLGIWMGEEAQLVRVGKVHPVTVVVLDPPVSTGERISATYQSKPQVGR
jgi:hypothetical protein